MVIKPLHLHPHDFLIGLHGLVAYLNHETDGNIRLFHGDHGFMQVFCSAGGHLLNSRIRSLLLLLDVADDSGKHFGEILLCLADL